MNTVGKNKDLRIALIVAAIGAVIYFVILPWQIDSLGMDDGLAPDLFPKMAAGAILLLGCLMTVNCLIAQDTFGSRQSTPLTWTTRGKVVAAVIIIALYLIALNWLGFIVSTPIFLFGFMLFLGARKLWIMVVLASIFSMLTYLVFKTFICVPLPAGLFFN